MKVGAGPGIVEIPLNMVRNITNHQRSSLVPCDMGMYPWGLAIKYEVSQDMNKRTFLHAFAMCMWLIFHLFSRHSMEPFTLDPDVACQF